MMQMIRRYSLPIVFLLLFFSSCSQDKIRLRHAIIELERLQVVVPEDMLLIQDGLVKPYSISDSIPLMIVYISPEECSDCRISHLLDYKELLEWGEDSGMFQAMIIFSPASEQMERIQDILLDCKSGVPVYLDQYSEFYSMNAIPDDPRVHCFLLNENRYPVFVGNPFANEQLSQLFKTALAARK